MTERTIHVDVPIISTKLTLRFSNSTLMEDVAKEISRRVFEHPAFPPSCLSDPFCLEENMDTKDSPVGAIQLTNPLSYYQIVL